MKPAFHTRVRRKGRGFSIMELMIVVAIIGLLAGIAVPGYQEYVRKGKRSEGKAALLAAASRLERFYTANSCYPSSAANCGTISSMAGLTTATGIQAYSGDDPGKASYDITVTFNSQDFIVTARPRAPFRDPVCGNLTLSNAGRKWTQSNGSTDDTSVPSGCW
jgi:type IV pilus assembly protein PilE